MGMGKWPYGYYKMGLRKGKRRMGMPENIVEVPYQHEQSASIADAYPPTTATTFSISHKSAHVDEQPTQPVCPGFDEEAARYATEQIKRQRVGAAPSETAPAFDLPSLQRQSMFALAVLIASRPPPSSRGQQPLLAPTPWFMGADDWQFLHQVSRGQGGLAAPSARIAAPA
ncbi:hypothetical protein T484DRAFT_1754169 [Baffinella frigidus]|nr:hypothetical protein T484DRAFT_1754169 [Cryptophyta sp. CCMP2293]